MVCKTKKLLQCHQTFLLTEGGVETNSDMHILISCAQL